MEGLEISEVRLDELERTIRMDAEFYSRKNIQAIEHLISKGALPITKFVSVSDGNHMTISDYYCEEDGVPYYRGTDIYNFFIEQANSPLKIEQRAFDVPNMRRSHLKQGDVLMSIVGAIIGNLSLVTTNAKATCSCKLAIMRPKNIDPKFLAMYLQSYYGQNQIQKYRRGGSQTGLLLEDFDQILIPEFSDILKLKIAEVVTQAYEMTKQTQSIYTEAQNILLRELGLKDFEPTREAVAVKSFSQSFGSSGRLDAEYYQPKYDEIVGKLTSYSGGYDKLSSLVSIKKSIEPGSDYYQDEGIPFVRVSNLSKFEITTPDIYLPQNVADKPDELKPRKDEVLLSKDGSVGIAHRVRENADFITSGAILRLQIKDKKEILPDVLALILNSMITQLQAERDSGGSIIQHWKVSEINEILIPIIKDNIQKTIADKINQSFTLREESKKLLELAKKAVEVAIEEGEDKAMKMIKNESQLN